MPKVHKMRSKIRAAKVSLGILMLFALQCVSSQAIAQSLCPTDTFADQTAQDDPNESVDANSVNNPLNVTVNDSVPGGFSFIGIVAVGSPSGGGTVTFNSDTIFYTPPSGQGGFTDTFDYAFLIGGDGDFCSEATVTVAVGPLGSIDAVNDQFNIVANSGAVDFDVLDNDSGDPISITSVTQGSDGGSVSIINGALISYTPPANFPNAFVDTFSYTIQGAGTLLGSEDTATVTVLGPDAPPPPPEEDVVQAREDNIRIEASQGRVELDVLDNDVGDNLVISSVNGSVRGRVGRTNDGLRIVYVPPTDVVGTITEIFSYSVASVSNTQQLATLKQRPTAAAVRLTVVGRDASVATPAIARVPTSSIGKIQSDLPVARAVENLCDLLTFRNDPRKFVNDPRPPGGLTAAQQDLRIDACSIVNEPDVGRQRSAIRQISGGQHQFSDTVLRFAKVNAGVITRRLSELRKLGNSETTPPSSSLPPRDHEHLVKNNLRLQRGESGISSIDNRRVHSNNRYDDDTQDVGAESTNESIVDTLSVTSNSTYMSFPLGGGAGDDDGLFGNRWGMFVSAGGGNGDGDDTEFEFDFNSYNVTVGIDKTLPGTSKTWVFGGAISTGKVETDAAGGAGETNSDSVGITLYGSMFGTNGWYLDGALDISQSDIDIDRVVDFTASGRSVRQTSRGNSDGDELGLSIGGGKDIYRGANTISTSIRLQYIDGSVDGLTENIVGQDSGFGLSLQTDKFDIESFRSEIGIQFNRAISTKSGVVLPFAGATWIHEFEDRGSDIPARFVVDPFSNEFTQLEEDAPGGSNRPTLFVIPGGENDSNYARLSFGSSFGFAGGKSAWISINTLAGLDSVSSTQYTAGFRWEFGN